MSTVTTSVDAVAARGEPRRAGAEPWRLVSLAFLVFASADAFCLPLLPLHAAALYTPGLLPEGIALGSPAAAFWLLVAAAQLTTAAWERDRDRRALFLTAMVAGTCGLAIAALAPRLEVLIVGRALSGFGHGMVLILVQDHLFRTLGARGRTLASGIYLSLFFGGYVVGSLAGSTLAEGHGDRMALLLAAGLSALGTAMVLGLERHRAPRPTQALRPRELCGNGRLVALVLLGALPLRILNGAVLYLLAPLYLHALGAGQTAAGRTLMIFPLVMALASTPCSRLVDHLNRPLLAAVFGAILSGAALLLIPAGASDIAGFAVALATLGLAQAIGMSPQVTLLLRITEAEVARFGQTSILGIYRVSERVGLFAGPLLAGLLLPHCDFGATFGLLGALVMVTGVALGAVLARPAASSAPSTPRS